MKTASKGFSFRASSFQDERSRIALLPTAVKLTRGNVSGAELLLQDAPTQAVLGDLRFVEAEYPTPLGIVHIRHEKTRGRWSQNRSARACGRRI